MATKDIAKIKCPKCGKEVYYYQDKDGEYFIRPHKPIAFEEWCEADNITAYVKQQTNIRGER